MNADTEKIEYVSVRVLLLTTILLHIIVFMDIFNQKVKKYLSKRRGVVCPEIPLTGICNTKTNKILENDLEMTNPLSVSSHTFTDHHIR